MQGSFDFDETFPPRPRRAERLFLCVMPGGEAVGPLGRFAEGFLAGHAPAARAIPAERLHVSLHHIRDDVRLREADLFAARQAVRRVALHPFRQCFRRATGFPPLSPKKRDCPLVLLGEGGNLEALHGQIADGMTAIGLRPSRGSVPHMTLAYTAAPLPMRVIPAIGFEVREVLLVHSRRGLSEYRVIDRWPLRG